ncbi:RNA-binding domain-containing protein [Methanolobus sp. ZRKC2]|uniref:RNA-binding domain-containing protein n=1 Tax=Methanolobus sp. ZRKC2 TaxID=3125783 RepID=UPI0032494CB0
MIKVTVSANVNPTEDREKVCEAINNIFPDIELVEEKLSECSSTFSGEGDKFALTSLHNLIREEEIIDTSRTRLNVGLSEDGLSTSFIISKQVATVGRLNYPAKEEPLGSINIEVVADSEKEMERFFDWLTPPTENGIPDFEINIDSV